MGGPAEGSELVHQEVAGGVATLTLGAALSHVLTDERVRPSGPVPNLWSLGSRVLHAAHELFLTGESFGADRAAELGLLNSVVSATRLDDEVDRFCALLALGGPGALSATKSLLRDRPVDVRGTLDALSEISAEHFASAEGQEGLRAFGDKRPAAWVPLSKSRATF